MVSAGGTKTAAFCKNENKNNFNNSETPQHAALYSNIRVPV